MPRLFVSFRHIPLVSRIDVQKADEASRRLQNRRPTSRRRKSWAANALLPTRSLQLSMQEGTGSADTLSYCDWATVHANEKLVRSLLKPLLFDILSKFQTIYMHNCTYMRKNANLMVMSPKTANSWDASQNKITRLLRQYKSVGSTKISSTHSSPYSLHDTKNKCYCWECPTVRESTWLGDQSSRSRIVVPAHVAAVQKVCDFTCHHCLSEARIKRALPFQKWGERTENDS